MKLVEAEATLPTDDREDAPPLPPPPRHRRVSVSLLLTLAILIGTVVGIYVVFPARHHVLLTAAIAEARAPDARWELAGPTLGEARAWTRGLLGDDAPLPVAASARVLGVRRTAVLERDVAVVRLAVGDARDEVTCAVTRAASVAPEAVERVEAAADGTPALHAIATRRGAYVIAVIGPEASVARWRPLVLAPP